MHWFFLIVVVLCIGALMIGPLANANPRALAKGLRVALALLVLLVSAGLIFVGRTGFGLPLAGFGVMMLSRAIGWGGGATGFGFPGQAHKSAGQHSKVRSAYLEMILDHDSGEMSGQFVAGPLAGRALTDMSRADLIAAYGELLNLDGQSAQLLQAYLDRCHEDWRDDFVGDANGESAPGSGTGGGAGSGSSGLMSLEEAFEILGLPQSASKADIRDAHRRLMKKLHPDQGGSTVLAAKVNQAKDLALGGR